jgi:ankyrin repeat protein
MSLAKEVRNDNTERVLEALQSPQDLNIKDTKTGHPLIHLAIENQNMTILRAIISHEPKPDLNILSEDGLPALSFAIELNNVEFLPELISSGADVNFLSAGDKMSPLQYAAKYNSVEGIKALLRGKANINYNSPQGTALHIAVKENNQEAAFELLENEKLDLYAQEPRTLNTLFHLAVENGTYGVIQRLFEISNEKNKIAEALKEVLNMKNAAGDTIMHMAEINGKETIANFLRKEGESKGLDLSVKNYKGLTASECREKYLEGERNNAEAKKAEQEIVTEKKKDKKMQQDLIAEEQNKIFDEKKKELEAIRKQQIEQFEKQNKRSPYFCFVLVILFFIGFYFYLDRYITGVKDNYLDL